MSASNLEVEIYQFLKTEGAEAVHRRWRDTMLAQGRDVSPERMEWAALPDRDKSSRSPPKWFMPGRCGQRATREGRSFELLQWVTIQCSSRAVNKIVSRRDDDIGLEVTMARRRKEVPCVLCKTPTLDYGGVCQECRDIYADGQQYRHMNAESALESKVYQFGGAQIIYAKDNKYDPYPESETYAFGELIKRILSPFVIPENMLARNVREYTYWLPRVTGEDFYAPWMYLRLTEDQRSALHSLVKLIQSIAQKQYVKGKADGKRLLFGLATGETTIEDYNRRTTMRQE